MSESPYKIFIFLTVFDNNFYESFGKLIPVITKFIDINTSKIESKIFLCPKQYPDFKQLCNKFTYNLVRTLLLWMLSCLFKGRLID